MDEGLIGGEGFAVDASVMKADASKQKHHEDDDDWGTRQPVSDTPENSIFVCGGSVVR